MRKNILIITLALIVALGLGFIIGSKDNETSQNESTNQTESINQSSENKIISDSVKSLITYSLPDGWIEIDCESSPGSVHIIPAGADSADCSTNPSSPVKLSVDPANTKDCNELQNVTEVKKHVCVSLFINDLRSLDATTEYLVSSSYGSETTLNAYYADTGKGVVKAEYIYNSENQYQIGFDQLVNSIKAI